MKKLPFFITFSLLLVFILPDIAAQDFSRVIQMQRSRMNGADVTKVQQRLVSLGFRKVGAVDGWYGPLTEGAVKTAQYYMGFPRDGKVTRAFWNTIFDTKQDGLLKNISIISNYNEASFTVTSRRNGANNDFSEFIIASQNNEVKTVTFRHVNEGLIIFRFKLWYLADAVFMIQDIYYGDYKTRVYIKTAQEFIELKNGAKSPADPAMEGILNRAKEGITSAGLTVPQLIPANLPVNTAPPAQPAVPAEKEQPAAAPAAATPPAAAAPEGNDGK